MSVHPDRRKKKTCIFKKSLWQRSARLELFILNFSYCTYHADGISFVLLKSLNKNVNTSLDDSQALPWAVIWGFLRKCPLSLWKYHCLEWLAGQFRRGITVSTDTSNFFPPSTELSIWNCIQNGAAAFSCHKRASRLLLIIYLTHTQKVPDSIFRIFLQIIQPTVHFLQPKF